MHILVALKNTRASTIKFLEDVEDEDYRELLKEEIKQLTTKIEEARNGPATKLRNSALH